MTTNDETPQKRKLTKRWPYSDEDNARILEIAKDYNHERAKKVVRDTLGWNVSAHHIGWLRRKMLDGNTSVASDSRNRTTMKGSGDIDAGQVPNVFTEQVADDTSVGVDTPDRITSQATHYKRLSAVGRKAVRRANGTCELCENGAPFRDDRGHPFLEVHHVISLSQGGKDRPNNTVALCPNCHRHCHHGEDREKVTEKLQQRLRAFYP